MHFWQVLLSNKNCFQGVKAESLVGSMMDTTLESNHPFRTADRSICTTEATLYFIRLNESKANDCGEINEHNKLLAKYCLST